VEEERGYHRRFDRGRRGCGGAVLGGGSGAKKGAVVGLVGGVVYDIATRSR
jgi:hypothetical protein